jgi:uncharacterized damage-inducible protein DinB
MPGLGGELAALFQRDLTRLSQQLAAFSDDGSVWQTLPGVTNSAGNLVLHLEGNLREYIGRQLGGVPYQRVREREFAESDVSVKELQSRVEALQSYIPGVISKLTNGDLEKLFPEQVFIEPMTTSQFLIHLHGHFNYHLGQIDYLRRVLTQKGAVRFAQI